jgi:hypothetical protein
MLAAMVESGVARSSATVPRDAWRGIAEGPPAPATRVTVPSVRHMETISVSITSRPGPVGCPSIGLVPGKFAESSMGPSVLSTCSR